MSDTSRARSSSSALAPSSSSDARPQAPKNNPFAPADPGLNRRRAIKDKISTVVVSICFILAIIPLVSLLWITVARGGARLLRDFPYFVAVSMKGVSGGMDAGGIYHAIIGTLIITALATLISAPIGLFTAVYVTEYGGNNKLARAIMFFVDVMTGVPSIVAGLFALSAFALLVKPGYQAGIVGAVALSVLMIPTVVRGCQEMLLLVPQELREAALALGVPKWRVILKVVLRTAAGGITTSIMLAIARIIGETAPLLFTAGLVNWINFDPFKGQMTTLPVYAYRQYSQGLVPCKGGGTCIADINYQRAWAAALALIILVMALNIIARAIATAVAPKGRN